MPETDLLVRPVPPAPEELRTAIPLPADPRFDAHLIALDHGFAPQRGERGEVHRGRPFRVLLLALLAVFIVLGFATVAAAAAWELAGERYVDDVIRDNF